MSTTQNDAQKADFDAIATDLAMLKRDVAALMSQLKSGAVRGAKEAAENTLDELSDRASRLYDKLATEGERSAEAISRRVEEQPIASLLIAFGVGFIVSRLLSR
jgi:ElaB/YqjD/DUF883 family membrane-anchored ribosome-binding protein